MAEATTFIEWWVQGTGENGFLNASGDFVALLGKVGDVARAEVVSRSPGVLSYWRSITVRVRHFHPVMVLLEPDAHCSLRFSHIAGRARTIGSSCTWSVVNHGGLVDVGDGVLEVDKLSVEGIFVVGYHSHLGPAKGASDHLGHAVVVITVKGQTI
jgi:hypothetical protein